MIRNIKVDGFRSLNSFELELKPGINVLVGPNGAGKTNIILFFDFLRILFSHGVSEAVGRLGGVGGVFRKVGRAKFVDKISFHIKGSVDAAENSADYELSGVIRTLAASQEIIFETQSIVISKPGGPVIVDLTWESSDHAEPKMAIKAYPKAALGEINHLPRKELERFALSPWVKNSSLLGVFQHLFPFAEYIVSDISSRSTLNVIPSVVKGLEDSSRSPGIDSTGAGLSATLYAIKHKKPIPDFSGRISRRPPGSRTPTWEKIISQIRVAVPSIEEIEVDNDPFDNRLRVKVQIGKGTKKTILPLASLSDGTVKWMSLVVRLATSRAALLLEEPENYLHPIMQQEVVRMLRSSVSLDGFVVLSTHSETLLNALRADEIIVVSYKNGATRACRVSNSEELNEEVAKTGFGLGYYYLADAIRS